MTRNSPPLLQANGLTQKFADTLAVDAISLTVNKGDVLGLLGLNGAGKSSTLRMLSGVLAPTAGDVLINGKSITEQPLEVKQRIGYLPEVAPLYPDMRVQDYLVYAAKLRRIPSEDRKHVVEKLLSDLNLQNQAKRTIGNLSKGYKQRVGLAQALVHNPDLLILDEPSSGLDPEQMRDMRVLIKKLGRSCGIIFSSHILSDVTEVCNRVSILHEGKLVHEGNLNESNQPLAGSTRQRIAFSQPVNAAAISCIPGVTFVEKDDTSAWIVETCGQDTHTFLSNLIAAGLRVSEFGPERPSLEALFSSLITNTPQASLI